MQKEQTRLRPWMVGAAALAILAGIAWAVKPVRSDAGVQMKAQSSWLGNTGVAGIYYKSGNGLMIRNTDDTETGPIGSGIPTQTGNSGKLLTTDGTNASWTSTVTSPVITTGLTASGSASNDFSGSSGTFKTSSGANTLSGDTSMATGKKLTVNAALLATTGSAPTVAPTASAGSTATASIVSGNDQRFELTITASGTGIGAGQWATVTFANTWASTPYCLVNGSRYSSGAVDWTWYADHNASSTTQLVIGNNFNTIGAGTYYVIVICMG